MNDYTIRVIRPDEYEAIRTLDSEAFANNERHSDGELHRVLADNVRRSPYFIPALDLVAVTAEGELIGHGIFSALPMGDAAEHVVWLNSLAVRHDGGDSHDEGRYAYQRRGIGRALLQAGLETAKALGYTACMTCGNPAIYRDKLGFLGCRELGIGRDETVDDPEDCVFARELRENGFQGTNKTLSYAYYDFTKPE